MYVFSQVLSMLEKIITSDSNLVKAWHFPSVQNTLWPVTAEKLMKTPQILDFCQFGKRELKMGLFNQMHTRVENIITSDLECLKPCNFQHLPKILACPISENIMEIALTANFWAVVKH